MSMDKQYSFRPRPRLMTILGEHLIRDNTVGLLELVKNGYDADATEVNISLKNLDNPNSTEITVRDNGHGMSLETLLGPWLEPAHGGKEDKKKKGQKSGKGRLPLGEKGVGRFAAQKLGRNLELVTRGANSSNEIVLRVSWEEFEKDDIYLDQVPVDVQEREPMLFSGNSCGTFLRMYGAKYKWTLRDLKKLQRNLRRLVSPSSFGKNNFKVTLSCPDYPEIEQLDPVDWLEEHYHYRFKGNVTGDGTVHYEYSFYLPPAHTKKESGSEPVWTAILEGAVTDREPECGPFSFTFYAWDRDADWLKRAGITRDDINNICGVSIYRDGFRVLPYGEPGDDWLKLDQRRINAPGEKLGNRQLVGFIELDQSINAKLIDKTNREGLQENQAFEDLQELVISCIEILERTRFFDRPGKSGKVKNKNKDLKSEVKELRKKVNEIKDNSKNNKKEENINFINDNMNENSKEPDNGMDTMQKNASPEIQYQYENEDGTLIIQEKDFEEIEKHIEKTETVLEEMSKNDSENKQKFMHLVNVGLASERFKHEFDRLVAAITGSVNTLKGRLRGKTGEYEVKNLDSCTRTLKNELRRLGALTYVQRAERESNVQVGDVICRVLEMNGEKLQENGINIGGDFEIKLSVDQDMWYARCINPEEDFCIRVRESSLAQIIHNVIDNAIYWLITGKITEPEIRIVLSLENGAIYIANNGPSISENDRPKIFEEFYTCKHRGTGLGLYIARELLRDLKGSIELWDELPGDNFDETVIFRITLPMSDNVSA